jgi:hypothetical protein
MTGQEGRGASTEAPHAALFYCFVNILADWKSEFYTANTFELTLTLEKSEM